MDSGSCLRRYLACFAILYLFLSDAFLLHIRRGLRARKDCTAELHIGAYSGTASVTQHLRIHWTQGGS